MNEKARPKRGVPAKATPEAQARRVQYAFEQAKAAARSFAPVEEALELVLALDELWATPGIQRKFLERGDADYGAWGPTQDSRQFFEDKAIPLKTVSGVSWEEPRREYPAAVIVWLLMAFDYTKPIDEG